MIPSCLMVHIRCRGICNPEFCGKPANQSRVPLIIHHQKHGNSSFHSRTRSYGRNGLGVEPHLGEHWNRTLDKWFCGAARLRGECALLNKDRISSILHPPLKHREQHGKPCLHHPKHLHAVLELNQEPLGAAPAAGTDPAWSSRVIRTREAAD